MNYGDAPLYTTRVHQLARRFNSRVTADYIASRLNEDRPPGCRPFRVEICSQCLQIHVSRGKHVFFSENAPRSADVQ